MSDNKKSKDVLREISADGIQEYDNPMPSWWLALLYGTMIFAISYMIYVHGPIGHTLIEALEDQHSEILAASKNTGDENKSSPADSEPAKAVIASPEAMLAEGKALYAVNCFPCHGSLGEGSIGPNLTDDYWLHGSSEPEIHKVISEGVPDKGMIAWKAMLSEPKITALTAFIKSLRGTNPPNAKAPQGQKSP